MRLPEVDRVMRGAVGSAACLFLLILALSSCAARTAGTPQEAQEPERQPLSPEAYHYYTTGNYLSALGEDSSAVAQYRKALTFDTDSREIRLALARAYASLGRFEEAAITAESARPRDAEVFSLLSDLYLRMKNPTRRHAVLEEWSRQGETDAQFWQTLSASCRSVGDSVGQIRALSHLTQMAQDPAVYEQLGLLYMESGKPDSAESWFRQALAVDTGQRATRVMLGMAQVFAERDQTDSARSYYGKAVDLNYYNTDLRKRYFYYLLQTPDGRPEALEQGRIVLKLSATEPDVAYRVAMLEYDAQQPDSAEVRLTRWISEYGDDGVARFLLGRIALERADSVTAEAQFLQSIAVADTLSEPYLSLAFLYNRWGQRDSALAIYDRGLKRLPDQPEFLFGRGATLEQLGRFDESVAVFEHLLEVDPNHAPALNYLGYMWADKGVKLNEALKLIERAVKLQPENGAYLDSHAWVLYRLGRLAEAETILRRALQLLDTDAVVFEHYGDVLADLGRLQEAREQWQRALSLDPDNRPLQEKLDR